MGDAYPELRRAEAADRRDPAPGGGALPPHARPRHGAARRGDRGPEAPATCCPARPRSSSTTPTAFRSTSPRTPCAPGASTVDTGRLRRGHGRASATMARESWAGSGQQAQGAVWLALRDRLGPTVFTGYDEIETAGEVLALVKDGAEVDARRGRRDASRRCSTARPSTPRAAARPATAARSTGRAAAAEVLDTQKQAGDLHVHALKITEGALDGRRPRAPGGRRRAARAHPRSTTPPPTWCTRRCSHVLGPHVAQKGQLVDGDRMRFDFSHGAPLTPAEIDAHRGRGQRGDPPEPAGATPRRWRPQAAIEAGAVALFGEKYGDSVRVLTLGRGARRRRRLFGRAVRRHPRGAHRRHRPLQDRLRAAASPPACAASRR